MNYQFDIALSFATENEALVESVYHYLKAEEIKVFFAPSQEGQMILSGKNQQEIFYSIFGMNADYVALFISKDYISKKTPMDEARIAFAKKGNLGKVIPIYLDETELPRDLFDPKNTNYSKSADPAVIASHLAGKIEASKRGGETSEIPNCGMNIIGNKSDKQFFIQTMEGNINL